jgi:exonuclease SbcC
VNPTALHLQNFRCYESLDLVLPDGCVAVLGDNGCGKSSLMIALDAALFGPVSRSLADLHARGADGDLLVELEFEHAGDGYRVRRTYSPRGRGKTTCDLEQLVDGTWTSLTRGSVKETDQLICETIGLNRTTFYASSFLAQGRGGRDFADAEPSARKKVLADVLGLDRYVRLQERARQDIRAFTADLQTLDGRTQAARDLVDSKQAVVAERSLVVETETEVADTIADLERDHEQLSTRYQEAREQGARRAAAEAELREATTRVAQLTQRTTAADEAARAIVAASLELDQLPAAGDTAALEQQEAALVAAVDEHARLVREREAAVIALRTAMNERDALIRRGREIEAVAQQADQEMKAVEAGELEHCPTCAQTLGAGAREATVDTLKQRVIALVDEANGLCVTAELIVIPDVPVEPQAPPVGDLDQVRGQLRTIRESTARRAQLDERIRQLEPAAAAGPLPDELTGALVAVTEKTAVLEQLAPVDVDEITRQGQLVKQRLDAARASIEQQRTLRARLDERLTQITTAEQQLAAAADDRDQLQLRLDVVTALDRAFGRDGIPALIVENSAIPYLETEANRILDALGTSFRVELRTQAELKTSDGLRETLDVVVDTETGEGAYETFSGGERTRINLALRIALARLLANRRGAESRLLSIDEPDGLDDTGMAALVDVLRGLQGDFDKLYIVSHVPALRDSFDTTLQVVRDGAWSRVNETGAFETVTA